MAILLTFEKTQELLVPSTLNIYNGTYTLSANSPVSMELATALQHGIRTDTDNFF